MRKEINNPRQSWSIQFEMAIANGALPESDMFEGISNNFDDEEWTWNDVHDTENNNNPYCLKQV